MSEIAEMLDDRDFIAEQDRMHGTRHIIRVVDVQGIDSDESRPALGKIFCRASCKEWMARHVCIRVPMFVPACIHEHSLAFEIEPAERALIDCARRRCGSNDD